MSQFTAGNINASLQSEICPACARPKPTRSSVCGLCWSKLPLYIQNGLYLDRGNGYSQALRGALRALGGTSDGIYLTVEEGRDLPYLRKGRVPGRHIGGMTDVEFDAMRERVEMTRAKFQGIFPGELQSLLDAALARLDRATAAASPTMQDVLSSSVRNSHG